MLETSDSSNIQVMEEADGSNRRQERTSSNTNDDGVDKQEEECTSSHANTNAGDKNIQISAGILQHIRSTRCESCVQVGGFLFLISASALLLLVLIGKMLKTLEDRGGSQQENKACEHCEVFLFLISSTFLTLLNLATLYFLCTRSSHFSRQYPLATLSFRDIQQQIGSQVPTVSVLLISVVMFALLLSALFVPSAGFSSGENHLLVVALLCTATGMLLIVWKLRLFARRGSFQLLHTQDDACQENSHKRSPEAVINSPDIRMV